MYKDNNIQDLVSVIIPVYNTEKYLDRCLSSIVNGIYKNIEIIIVDDKSKDNSLNVCKKWSKKDSRIVLINKDKNTGASDSRNKGLDIAKGKYVLFVDSDDYIEDNMIEELVNNIKENKSDLSMCGINVFDENNKKAEPCNFPKSMDKIKFFKKIIVEKYNTIWNKLFIREKIGKIRFDITAHINEDSAFLCEYVDKISKTSKVSFVNKNLYNYNNANANSVTHGNSEKYITGIKTYYTINKILEKYNLEERFFIQADSVCNLTLHKHKIGKDFDYREYDKIIKEYMDNGLLRNVKGIKRKIKVFLAYYLKHLYLILKEFEKKNN